MAQAMNAKSPAWVSLPHVVIGGLRVAVASRAELARAMVGDCLRARDAPQTGPRLVFDSNGHALSSFATDPLYRAAMDCADVIHADGGFIVTASRRLAGRAIAERSATTDLIHDFAAAAEQSGLGFYLLGGSEEVNAACAKRLNGLYPKLRIVGRHHGYFAQADEEKLLEDIAQAAPDLLWIGLGKPREQIFAVANRDRLKAGWVITCGGCYNYITGHYGRAPHWMQRSNLEWLYRALSDPRKLLWRYLTTTPHALWLTIKRVDRNVYSGAKADDCD